MAKRRFDGSTVRSFVVQAGAFLLFFVAMRAATRWILSDSSDGWSLWFLITPIIVGVVGAAVFGWVFLLTTMGNHVRSVTFRPGDPRGWPPASGPTAERFRRMGFEQFGSVEVEFPDHTAVFAGLLSPDARTMAIVTPRHLSFVSDFDGKVLSTTNEPASAPSLFEIRQSQPHGSPEELWDLHSTGLAVASASGMTPSAFTAAQAVATFIEIEESAIAGFSTWSQAKHLLSRLVSGRRRNDLAQRRNAAELIEAWRSSPHNWQVAH